MFYKNHQLAVYLKRDVVDEILKQHVFQCVYGNRREKVTVTYAVYSVLIFLTTPYLGWVTVTLKKKPGLPPARMVTVTLFVLLELEGHDYEVFKGTIIRSYFSPTSTNISL